MNKNILDVCCGSRMFWFDKYNPNVIFNDIRRERHTLCDGRTLDINPDTKMDFRKLEFEDNRFSLVVFDPPHLLKLGKTSWMAKKYGILSDNWQEDLTAGFKECFRVLKEEGILIFKWNERDIKISEILKLTKYKPLFGHTTGRSGNTKWVCFMKSNEIKMLFS
jgi:ubiquinone/menaquinone biosynthesis C-methylase UbiE